MTQHMAIDQYGATIHALGTHPRAELLRRLGRKNARKMFVDDKHGVSHHIGWIVGGHWLTVYAVTRMDEVTS